MDFTNTQIVVWLTSLALLTFAAATMIYRGFHRIYPVFFAYLVFHIVRSPITMIGGRMYGDMMYFILYWAGEFIDGVISLAVIEELFSSLFQDHEVLQPFQKLVFRWSVLLLFGIAIVSAWTISIRPIQSLGKDPIQVSVVTLQQSLSFVECGVLFLVFLLARSFALGFKDVPVGVGIGLGFQAAVVAVIGLALLRLGLPQPAYDLISPSAYAIATAVWFYYLVRAPKRLALYKVAPMAELELWNSSLNRMLQR